MKKICLLIVVVFCCTAINCFGELAVKEKKISKHYNVGASDKLEIENKYGKVEINTWDKNEISVEVTVTVKMRNEDKAQGLLDDIQIEESQGRSAIYFKTTITRKNVSLKDNENMTMNYVVNMPRKNALIITNRFGNVSLDDFDGSLDLDVEYGNVTTKRLQGADKKMKIGFGKAEIESIEKGTLDLSYSNLDIDKAQNITVKNKFGKTTIRTIQTLDITQRYGSMDIGSVGSLYGSAEFSGLDIDKATKEIDMTLKYCSNANFGIIDAGLDLIKVNASFSSMYFSPQSGANLSATISLSFGDFKNRLSSNTISMDREPTDKFSHLDYYKGRIGNGSGKMSITGSYSDVVFK